uniref:Uncharacterized protein n=1 Tax=Arundo donax TaxID=35708 RepID=A0A0A9GTQ2_ARUDO
MAQEPIEHHHEPSKPPRPQERHRHGVDAAVAPPGQTPPRSHGHKQQQDTSWWREEGTHGRAQVWAGAGAVELPVTGEGAG